MPKVSIITTTYKHQDFIAQTIGSIIEQRYTDRELLIGDDSPDNATRDIIESYVEKYPDKIKARHHFPNKGIVNNMNFLIDKASDESKYIAFLEGDDMYTPNNLSEKINIFEKYNTVQLVYNDISIIDNNNKIVKENLLPNVIQGEIIPLQEFIKKDVVYCSYSSLMLTKKAMHTTPIRDLEIAGNIISDRDFFGRVADIFPIRGISKALTLYRRHGSGLTGSFTGKQKLLDQLKLCVDRYYAEGKINKDSFDYFSCKIYISQACNGIFLLNKGYAWDNLKLSLQSNILAKWHLKICVILGLLLPTKLLAYMIEKMFQILPNLKKKLIGS